MSTHSVPVDAGLADNTSPVVLKPKRYHPALVALHWLIAILIFGTALLAQEGEGEGGRERFEPGEGNFSPQGLQQGNPAPGFQQENPAEQGLPPQVRNQSIFSRIGIH